MKDHQKQEILDSIRQARKHQDSTSVKDEDMVDKTESQEAPDESDSEEKSKIKDHLRQVLPYKCIVCSSLFQNQSEATSHFFQFHDKNQNRE